MERGQACASHCCVRAGGATGQAGAEYLILLGAAGIIGMVVVALLAFFPGTAPGISQSESEAYWKTASPIAVREAQGFGGLHVLRLKNIGMDTIYINGVGVEGQIVANDWFYYGSERYGSLLEASENGAGPNSLVGPYQFNPPVGWCQTPSSKNCSIQLNPGGEINLQYLAYPTSLPVWWSGQPEGACGALEDGGKNIYYNSFKKYAYADLQFYYTVRGVQKLEKGSVKLVLECIDFDFRCSIDGDCYDRYVAVTGYCADTVQSPGMCFIA